MTNTIFRFTLLLALAVALAACGGQNQKPVPQETAVEKHPADLFMAALRAHCGKAYRGRLTAFNERDQNLLDREMVMHVRQCSANEIRVPFHVGDDRSRTWIFTRTESGLRLKHDHRHADGAEEDITQYGGDTASPGTAQSQSFPADAFTAEMLPAAAANVWTVSVVPGEAYIYELRREADGRHFRVEFDLSAEVPPPPAPWGHEDTVPFTPAI